MRTDSFRDYVLEQLADLDGLRCRAMFDGSGLYSGEQLFGIVYDGRLYFKAHPDTLPDYLSHHCAVFAPHLLPQAAGCAITSDLPACGLSRMASGLISNVSEVQS